MTTLKVSEIRSRIKPDLQVVAQNGLPFEVKASVPNAATRAAVQEVESGHLPRFNRVQDLFDDLEKADES
jgi:antitoxin component of RelBE/YafQ-DinJ toxin-antitoxin module